MALGELDIYVGGQWKDAYTQWGLSFEDEGLSKLVTPRPHKQPVTNKNVTASGAHVISTTVGYEDERTISIPMHITAPDKATFWSRYRAFCSEVLGPGTVTLRSNYFKNSSGSPMSFSLIYQDVQNFTEFMQQMAKFDVVFYESNG